ncbi:3'-5' exonuclease [Blastococcus deserti]|uniref:PolC-type DNA polymerase III n=1 Tax=Blastococcus deserti TaxID=2259033 RepID=A0ABW4XH24_9ACTN
MFGVPIEVLVGVLVATGLGLLAALFLAERSSSRRAARKRAARKRQAAGASRTPAVPARRTPVPVAEPDGPLAFAEPGLRGGLFQYGGDASGLPVEAPYAVLAIETTGLSPAKGDRIVEIAVVRVDARGRVEDEYATLIDPGRDVGPLFVHGIANSDVLDAPTFEEVAGEVLARMEGAVVVAHNAAFVERFLAAELARMDVALPLNPALCALWLARRTMRTPDSRLPTLARAAGVPADDAHTARADARTVAALLPRLLGGMGTPPRYLTGLRALPELHRGAAPRIRAGEPRTGGDGWLASMVARLPRSVVEAPQADAQRYLDALVLALAEGRIVGGEAQHLLRLGGSAGLGAEQVLALHRRCLDHLRATALEGVILTTAELRQLKTVASGLGLADFFDDLRPTSPQDLLAARLR